MTPLPIDLDAFEAAPVSRDPFAFAMVPRFVKSEAMTAINADYPLEDLPCSFPLPTLSYGPAFTALIAAIEDRIFDARSRNASWAWIWAGGPPWSLRGACRQHAMARSTPTAAPS